MPPETRRTAPCRYPITVGACRAGPSGGSDRPYLEPQRRPLRVAAADADSAPCAAATLLTMAEAEPGAAVGRRAS